MILIFKLSHKDVIDLYRTGRNSVLLIDVNPFGDVTDSLLFDWVELRSKVNAPPPPKFKVGYKENFLKFLKILFFLKDSRFIEDRIGIQKQKFELNSLPIDVFNGNISLNL